MSTKTQLLDCKVKAPTREGLSVELSFGVLYRLNPANAVQMYANAVLCCACQPPPILPHCAICAMITTIRFKTVGKKYSKVVVEPTVRAVLRNQTARYEAKDLYQDARVKVRDSAGEWEGGATTITTAARPTQERTLANVLLVIVADCGSGGR